MAKARRGITELTKKHLMQESGGRCPLCDQADVATLEYHHIDSDPLNNDFSNLLIVCSSCHSKINRGIIKAQNVLDLKNELRNEGAMKDNEKPAVSVNIEGSTFKGDIAQNIYKIAGKPEPPPVPVLGSIRASSAMKGYIDYLLKRYHDFRKADRSYGRNIKYNYNVVHAGIQRRFGVKTFDVPESKFNELVEHLEALVDGTIQGKRNRKSRKPNYHSYEEHRAKFGL